MKSAAFAFLLSVPGLLLAGAVPALAQVVAESYSYFDVGGRTMEAIEAQLDRRGPQVGASGARHPGATRMQFVNNVTYVRTNASCRIQRAVVQLTVKVILPRWVGRSGAADDVTLVWDTLSSDIKRHEEQHVGIARNYAENLQDALRRLKPRGDCDSLKTDVAAVSARTLKRHDAAQLRFDQSENAGFQKRFERLLQSRMKQQAAGN